MGSPWWKAIRWLVGIVVVVEITRQVIRNWQDIAGAQIAWAISPLPIAASVVLVWGLYALLVQAWRLLVVDWSGVALPWWTAVRIWIVSSMGKYVPGKVWTIAGMAVMAQRQGVTPWVATSSAILNQLLALGTGALLMGLTGMVLGADLPGGRLGLWLLLAGATIGTGVLLWPPAAAWASRRLGRLGWLGGAPEATPRLRTVLFGVAVNSLAWVGYGIGLWLLAVGTLPDVHLGITRAIGVYAASYMIGFLVPFAPGGLGVREGVLFSLLRNQIGPGEAAALAAISRIGLTITEVGAVLPFLSSAKETARGRS